MPAPVYETKSSTGEQYAAAFVPAVPAGTASGDLLVACCWMNGTAIDSAPAGWTQQVSASSGSVWLTVFTKVATASESSPTFSAAYGSYGEVIVYRLSGVDGTVPVDASATATGSLDAPSVTTTGPDRFILHLFGSGSGSGSSISVPPGDTALDTPTRYYTALAAGYVTAAAAGATAAATFDDGGMTYDQVTATLAITPDSAGGPPSESSGIILERGLQHFWPLSNQDASDVWAGDAFGNPPHPSVGTLSDAASSPHPTLGATRLTNEGHTSTATWQASSAAFDPTAYTFAGWLRPVYPDIVQRGFRAGIDPSQNNIGSIVRHSDNAKTYGLDGNGGLVTRDVSPDYEYGNWQFVCLRVTSTEVLLNVDAEPPLSGSRGSVRSPGSANWELFVPGNGASIAPVEYHGWGVWDRPLSDDEVTALFNSGTAIAFPLLTNGEPETALSLGMSEDMTPRLLPHAESLTLLSGSVVSPVLPDSQSLTLQPASDITPPVLPPVEELTLHSGSVASPSLPGTLPLMLGADRPVSPAVPPAAALTLHLPGDVTPPVLPQPAGLSLEPVLLGPELPDVIAGLALGVGVPGPVLPSSEPLSPAVRLLGSVLRTPGLALASPAELIGGLRPTAALRFEADPLGAVLPSVGPLNVAVRPLGSVIQTPGLALANPSELFGGLAVETGLTLRASTLGTTLPAAEPLTLQPTRLGGGLRTTGNLLLQAEPVLFAGLAASEPLALTSGLALFGPNDLQPAAALTLFVAAEFPDPRLLAATEPLNLALTSLPGTLRTPMLRFLADDSPDARLLTVSRQLMLRADRFVTHSFERVSLIGLRSRRARLQSLAVTN
jgi:hypothetical protein